MVKKAMAHSWAGYIRYAWGFDELRPVTMDGENSFCGLGATIVDSLDTLWLMDMKQEFQRGTDWVRDVFQTEKCAFPSPPECSLGRCFLRTMQQPQFCSGSLGNGYPACNLHCTPVYPLYFQNTMMVVPRATRLGSKLGQRA
jgi:hypothetical protein